MTSENDKMDIESTIPPEMNIYIDNILGIKSTNPNYQNYFSSYLNLISILKEIKFKEKNNKKSEKDIKQETIEQIENLSKNSAKQIKSEKEKNFNSFTSTKNKTKYFHTAEQDEISPTLYAFYFCEKSKQILTDHQAAALKDANIDTDYLKNSKDLNSEDFLDTSTNNINNGNLNGNNNNNLVSNSKEKNFSTPLLNKKRKGSISAKTNKTSNKKNKKNEKKENNNKEKNNSEEENNNTEENNNKNNNEEYCLPTCKLGRKTTYNVMIMCDECKKWFHAQCVNEPENAKILEQKDWLCPFCNIKKNDKMMLEKPMINNIKYNNNNNNNAN